MKALGKDFRHLSRQDKLQRLEDNGWISSESHQELLDLPLLSEEVADSLIENVITQGALPVGLLPEIIVEGKHYAVPMMVEEPSVVAAASYGSKLVNKTGGFKVESSERLMIGQIVFMDVKDPKALAEQLLDKEDITLKEYEVYVERIIEERGIKAVAKNHNITMREAKDIIARTTELLKIKYKMLFPDSYDSYNKE